MIRGKRARVVAELPHWEQLRLAGSAAKDELMGHLAAYLEQLETNLTRNGAVVHWARDAAEACQIVVQLAQAKGADEVVKVKSMATQEIELNEALEAAGIRAWETDLAELIVQLGHDRPSHILVPAIHRNRSEIREIFRREMHLVGRPAPDDLTDEPKRLAEAARLHLREKFLRAKVAVSGANFAIADTGSLVVVESEGNGRMCLTLPETLISVVGIEKVLPTWQDLGTFMPVSYTHLDVYKRQKQTWPVALVVGAAFAVTQWIAASFISVELTDIIASLVGLAAAVVVLRFWQPVGKDEAHVALAKERERDLALVGGGSAGSAGGTVAQYAVSEDELEARARSLTPCLLYTSRCV